MSDRAFIIVAVVVATCSVISAYAQDPAGHVLRERATSPKPRVLMHSESSRFPMVTLSDSVLGEVSKRRLDSIVIRPSNLTCVHPDQVIEMTHGVLGDLSITCVQP